MNKLKTLLKTMGLDDKQIEEVVNTVKDSTKSIIENRLKRFKDGEKEEKMPGKDSEKLEELKRENHEKLRELKKLRELVKGSKDAEKLLSEKLVKLEEEKESIIENEKMELNKKLDEFTLSEEKSKEKYNRLYDTFKKERLLNISNVITANLKLKNPSIAAKYLVNMGYLDLAEETDDKTNRVDYVVKTKEIVYEDEEKKKEVKKVFSGIKDVEEAVKILVKQNDEVGTLFPVMEEVAAGSGSSGGMGNHKEGSFEINKAGEDELLKLGEKWANE